MKSLHFVDPYPVSSVIRDSGYQTDNGVIKVLGNYTTDKKLKYITIFNSNGKKVHVTAKLIPELIEMLKQY